MRRNRTLGKNTGSESGTAPRHNYIPANLSVLNSLIIDKPMSRKTKKEIWRLPEL